MMTAESMSAHVAKLAVEHRITIEGIDPLKNVQDSLQPMKQGFSFPETRTIQVNPVVDEETYMIALHEIGHVVTSDEDDLSKRRKSAHLDVILALLGGDREAFKKARMESYLLDIESEARASTWAFDHALEVTNFMKKITFDALMSHL